MAIYCIVTSVEASDVSPGHIEIGYEVREGDAVLHASTMGLVVPTDGEALSKRDSLRAQVEQYFAQVIARLEAKREIIAQLPNDLVGLRYPADDDKGIVKGG